MAHRQTIWTAWSWLVPLAAGYAPSYTYSGWCPTPRPAAELSVLSPYKRPAALQPLRLASEVVAAAYIASQGCEVPKLGEDIELRSSPGRGQGLYALRDFEPGELVAQYSGVRATYAEFQRAWEHGVTSGDYLFESRVGEGGEGQQFVDATRDRGCALGRFVNHSVRKKNTDLVSLPLLSGVEYVQTTRLVKAGEEFFTDYGTDYWDTKLGPWPTPQRLVIDFL